MRPDPQSDAKVPAVVVSGNLNALGVVRSLVCGGMPIYVVAATRWCPAGWSRHCRFVRVPGLEGRALIDGLKRLGARLGQRPVLIINGDREVEAISNHRDEIAPLFRFSLPSSPMVQMLSSKTHFQAWAEQQGFPVPKAVILNHACELRELTRLTLPLVMKPANKTLVLSGSADRAVRVETPEQAQATATRMLADAQSLVAQEWIDGSDDDIYFTLFVCDAQSNLIAMFSGRKLICSPPLVGSTAVCVGAPEVATELIPIIMQFISRSKYRGIGSLEFKRDRACGRFMIVEPTVGRTDWQEEVATLNGVNIPLIAYQVELQKALPAAIAVPAHAAWRSTIRFRVAKDRLGSDTRIWDGYFRIDDPLPGLYHYGVVEIGGRVLAWTRRVRRYFQRMFTSTKHWLLPS